MVGIAPSSLRFRSRSDKDKVCRALWSGFGLVGSIKELGHCPLVDDAKADLTVRITYSLGAGTYAESAK